MGECQFVFEVILSFDLDRFYALAQITPFSVNFVLSSFFVDNFLPDISSVMKWSRMAPGEMLASSDWYSSSTRERSTGQSVITPC